MLCKQCDITVVSPQHLHGLNAGLVNCFHPASASSFAAFLFDFAPQDTSKSIHLPLLHHCVFKIERPDNPTSQLLPISTNKEGKEGRKNNGSGGRPIRSKVVCKKLRVTKLCVCV